MPRLHANSADPFEQMAAAFDDLSATMKSRVDALQEEIDAIGNRVIPAASRRASIEPPMSLGRKFAVDGKPDQAAERKAIATFIRTGDESGLEGLGAYGSGMELEAGMMVGSDPDGGYTVTPVLSDAIAKKTFDVSPIGRLARREVISTGDAFEEPVDSSDIGAEWVGETDSRPALDTAKLKYMRVPVHEIYTTQPVTQRLLDDSRFDIGSWMEGKIADKFARKEGAAYIAGDGVNKPQGLFYRPTASTDDGARDYFTLQHINTGVDGGFDMDPSDVLVDLVYKLRAPYRQNARWLMNLKTAGIVRKMKDAEGNYVWINGIAAGQPALLLGYPVEIDEEMPDIASGSLSIAFGDFKQGYIIVEKPGIRMLRDPYTAKPNVLFYAYRRSGGQVQNGEAIKVLRFSAAD